MTRYTAPHQFVWLLVCITLAWLSVLRAQEDTKAPVLCTHHKTGSGLAQNVLVYGAKFIQERNASWINPAVLVTHCSANDFDDGADVVQFIRTPYSAVISGTYYHATTGEPWVTMPMSEREKPFPCPQSQAVLDCPVLPVAHYGASHIGPGPNDYGCPRVSSEAIQEWCAMLPPAASPEETYKEYLQRLLKDDVEKAVMAEMLRFVVYEVLMWEDTLSDKVLEDPHVSYYCQDTICTPRSFRRNIRMVLEHINFPRHLLYELLDKLDILNWSDKKEMYGHRTVHGHERERLEGLAEEIDHKYFAGRLADLNSRVREVCMMQPQS